MRRLVLIPLVLFLFSASAFCEEEKGRYQEGSGWLLSALPFELSGRKSKAVEQAAQDIPSLILEKIAGDASHVLSFSEQLDRQLFQLHTDRLSLCLQLSRELKVRDGLVLGEPNARKLKKKISEAEKKIAGLEESIRKNLAEVQDLKGRYDREGEEPSVVEDISILDSDGFSLLKLPDDADVAQEAVSKGLSGLISGSIETFGNFISVTAELHCYPGGWSAGSVTEVGELNEISELADNLVVALLPKIANNIPVEIYFSITPEEALADCQIFIDGILLKEGADVATVSYGEHKVEICSDGYFTKSVSYSFTESSQYSMVVPMEKVGNGTFDLTFYNVGEGAAFSNAAMLGFLPSGQRNLPVTINGKPVLGRFIPAADFSLANAEAVSADSGGKSGSHGDYYFYAAPKVQQDGGSLAVKLKERPSEELINRRRIWSYRGYSAFMLALPAALLAYGNYKEVKDGLGKGGEIQGTADNALDFANSATVLAALSGGFFLWQLFRYIHTVSGVLPQEAYTLDDGPVKLEDFTE
ncbi:MAG: hypothetical protein ILP18_06220 [Treponema sp.]|nr:hypothetical protein [Treponema sp.]